MLEDRLDVTEAKSRASTSATFSPRVAASSADPEPPPPPPITTTSNCSLPRRSQAAARCSGPRNEPGRVCALAGTRIGSLTAQSPVGYSSVGRWAQGYLTWANCRASVQVIVRHQPSRRLGDRARQRRVHAQGLRQVVYRQAVLHSHGNRQDQLRG